MSQDITDHYVLRHFHTRWLSIEKVLVHITEQFHSFRECFSTGLPKQRTFRKKNAVGNTDH